MKETVTFLYIGQRYHRRDNTTCQVLVEVDPITNNGERFLWDTSDEKWYEGRRKPMVPSYAQPGSVLSVDAERKENGGMTLYGGTVKLLGQWANVEQVAEWQASSRAERQEYEAQSEARQKVSKRRDLEALDPIRNAYLMASSTQRPFILANAISYITRGTTTKREE